MEYSIEHAPTFSTVQFQLNKDEFVVAQPSSMLSMTSKIALAARVGQGRTSVPTDGTDNKSKRSWSSGFGRLLGGESFFTAEFRAKDDAQSITLAPDTFGDIVPLKLNDETSFYLTHGSYLANIGDTITKTKYGGFKGLMSRKGLFLLEVSGSGHVFCQSYGAVIHKKLDEGETLFVDNRFMVAFSTSIDYKLVKATESVKDTIMSGEGLINRYTGPGHVYYQTRSKPSGGMLAALLDAVF